MALNASWDEDLLPVELKKPAAINFDACLTGFDIGKIDTLIDGTSSEVDPADETQTNAGAARCQLCDSGAWVVTDWPAKIRLSERLLQLSWTDSDRAAAALGVVAGSANDGGAGLCGF